MHHFDQVSQLEISSKGLAHHVVELIYLFQTLEDKVTVEQVRLSRKLGADFIQLAHSTDLWRRFEKKNGMVHGPDDK